MVNADTMPYMNRREHPPMYFQAVYAEHEALIKLDGAVYVSNPDFMVEAEAFAALPLG
ncbi:MAG: hypothetical protein HY848_22040 [Betaproteobacteria bacterium]|nr:hypothetical protein [Betaproteobacteria bacterium]